MASLIRYAAFAILVAVALSLPAAAPDTLDFKVYREAQKDYFNALGWMIGRLATEITSPDRGLSEAERKGESDVEIVKRYLKLNEQIAAASPRASSRAQPADPEGFRRLVEERDCLEPQAQTILRKQVEEVLREEGFASVAGRQGVFPPPMFAFTPLPKILVISPRDSIRTATTLALRPSLTWAEAETIEEQESRLGISALVVPIGGLGLYPPMLPRTSSLDFLAQAIPHEWAHNYFTLRPLGVRYSLQIEKDYEVITMNESAASIIGEEIGDRLLTRYYGYPQKEHPKKPQPKKAEPQSQEPPAESDFGKRMRAIRLKVDDYLAKGQVDEAERYMLEEQGKLQADGYDVRKLNQAYFAFYGSYATSPGFTNPIGDAVADLRYHSPSLKGFVDTVGEMTSYGALQKAVVGN